jgi:hypothetical protein
MACTYPPVFEDACPLRCQRRVRERLKEVLRQYELRERHFECVIRSKELEVLLSRARAAEQKQLAEGEKAHADRADEEVIEIPFLSVVHHFDTDLESTYPEGARRCTEWSNDANR